MNITIANLLPKGFNLEIFQTQKELIALVNAELSNDLWRPFMERVLFEMKHDPDNAWTMWEGFWKDEGNGFQTEIIVGALHLEGTVYTRGMRVKHVPPDQIEEVQGALKPMIEHYMSQLAHELERKVTSMIEKPYTSFGEGKSKQYQCSICHKFWPKDLFGHGFGNNPQPVLPRFEDRCCDKCNSEIVIPTRLARMSKGLKPYESEMNVPAVEEIAEALERGEEVPGINPPPTGSNVIEIPIEDIKTVLDEDEDKKK